MDDPAARPWSPVRRAAFRALFAYMALYILPFPFDGLLGYFGVEIPSFWRTAVPWVGKHVLGTEITIFPNGSGDTTYNYVEVLCLAAAAAVAALVWTLVDRRSDNYRRLHGALRVFVRYYLAFQMINYGLAKVFVSQFPIPSADRLLDTYGYSSPMGLLWTFMGASVPYQIFAGLMECLGGLLLFFRRTATLGALVVVAVMTNVVLLNFCYDVPVKLFSSHLLLFAAWAASPDLGRLVDVLIRHRPTSPEPIWTPFRRPWMNITRLVLKSVVIVGFNGLTVFAVLTQRNLGEPANPAPKLPFADTLFTVDSFTADQSADPPGSAPTAPWRRVYFRDFGRFCGVSAGTDAGPRDRYRCNAAPGSGSGSPSGTMTWSDWSTNTPVASLTYTCPDDQRLVLEGTVAGRAVRVELRRAAPPNFLLTTRGFRWINEFPFNR